MSEKNEEIENYAGQDCEMLNTMEATTELCFQPLLALLYVLIENDLNQLMIHCH